MLVPCARMYAPGACMRLCDGSEWAGAREWRGRQRLASVWAVHGKGVLSSLKATLLSTARGPSHSLSSIVCVFMSVCACARVWCVLVTGDMEFEDSLSMGTA